MHAEAKRNAEVKGALATDPYTGVRDFYPEDMAVQRFIFETWSKTAERFGFERYDASILEPAELYRSKGAVNEEIVNDQTYTFTDRGEREVTLRPEMTPTVARMVSKRRRELAFPLRWYAIPNLYRYERPQRGRLREHWQLNCDLFGGDPLTADVEMILLAAQTLFDFGATPELFTVRINHKQAFIRALERRCRDAGFTAEPVHIHKLISIADKKHKLGRDELTAELGRIIGAKAREAVADFLYQENVTDEPEYTESEVSAVISSLQTMGLTNVTLDHSLARGFDYYTGTIFEIYDTASENGRALLGGGRYDNLTELFGGEPISGVGFGMGDVTMRDFLETHQLIPEHIKRTGPHVMVIPLTPAQNLVATNIAQQIRQAGFSAATDIGNKKIGDRISKASARGAAFVTVIGEDEVTTGTLTLKNLVSGEERTGPLGEVINFLDIR